MYRDDLIIQGLAAGATSTATLAKRSGLSTASVGRGLQRLMMSGRVFSPLRGVYRLTASGQALLGQPDQERPALPEPSAETASDQSLLKPEPLVTSGSHQGGPDEQPGTMEHHDADAVPASPALARRFDWRAFGVGAAIVLGGLAFARLLHAVLRPRQVAPPLEEPGQPAASGSFPLGIGPTWWAATGR